jgi:hypothetical protein
MANSTATKAGINRLEPFTPLNAEMKLLPTNFLTICPPLRVQKARKDRFLPDLRKPSVKKGAQQKLLPASATPSILFAQA